MQEKIVSKTVIASPRCRYNQIQNEKIIMSSNQFYFHGKKTKLFQKSKGLTLDSDLLSDKCVHHFKRKWENDGRVLFGRYGSQCL